MSLAKIVDQQLIEILHLKAPQIPILIDKLLDLGVSPSAIRTQLHTMIPPSSMLRHATDAYLDQTLDT